MPVCCGNDHHLKLINIAITVHEVCLLLMVTTCRTILTNNEYAIPTTRQLPSVIVATSSKSNILHK